MQCCMSVVDDNIENTEKQVKLIYNLKKYDVDIIFGGPGIELLPNVKKYIDTFSYLQRTNKLI